MIYNGKVSAEFIRQRDVKVEKDKRDFHSATRQWDFEFPEYHQASLNNGHILYEGFEYDTTHKFFGNCDFKHVNAKQQIHISKYIYDKLCKGIIEHIVTWKFVDRNWKQHLAENDIIKYDVLDYISTDDILRAISDNTSICGCTINLGNGIIVKTQEDSL
jgi:hypothetical protein|tara:strand:- start:3548 stop:4027 length:480 start_codon:yes stop_codon:yes gene_type:complete